MSTAHPATVTRTLSPPNLKSWVMNHQVASFFILTFAFSWSLWLLAYLSGESILAYLFFGVGAFGPMISAATITKYTGGSVGEWARRIIHWRVPGRYYLIALGLPALIWTVISIELALFDENFDLGLLPRRLLISVGTFFLVLTFGGGFEEPGWRGFALGRLQQRLSPVRATLLLGFVWGLWHVPVMGPLAFPFVTMLAFFYTYLYNKTGSVLLAILLHASFTPASDNFALVPRDVHGINDVIIFGTVLVSVIVLVLATRGRLGYEGAIPPAPLPPVRSSGRQGTTGVR